MFSMFPDGNFWCCGFFSTLTLSLSTAIIYSWFFSHHFSNAIYVKKPEGILGVFKIHNDASRVEGTTSNTAPLLTLQGIAAQLIL